MILIISERKDVSTNKVIDWLKYLNKDFFRLNFEDSAEIEFSIDHNHSKTLLVVNSVKYDIDEFKTIYYRRGDVKYRYNLHPNVFYDKINQYFSQEWKMLKQLVYSHPYSTRIGDFYKEINSNKLIDNQTAVKAGFKIPKTIATSSKKNLLEFLEKIECAIVKPLHGIISIISKDLRLVGIDHYSTINKGSISICPESFFPIIAQEYIEKSFEIRVFFIKSNLYSMAIFSQSDNGTKFDFRESREDGNETRSVPYLLAIDIKKKVLDFINLSGLTTGSIDLIVNKRQEVLFLEVNPAGQFDWVSSNCNYYIEKKIAELL